LEENHLMLALARVALSSLIIRKFIRPQTQTLSLITNFNCVFILRKLTLQSLYIFKSSKIKIAVELWKLKAVLLEHNAQSLF
jgi:hypothetical protein